MEINTIKLMIEKAVLPILLCNKNKEIIFANASFENTFQLKNEDCSGKLLSRYLVQKDNEKSNIYEFILNPSNAFEVKCTINPINNDLFWISLKKNSVKEYQLRLEAIINSAVDGIIIINRKGIIEEINPAGAKVFGYDKNEVVGNNIKMLMPQPHRSKHDQYIGNYLHTGEKKIIGIGREVQGKKKNGDLFPFRLGISEVKLNDRTIFTGIIHDLSDRVRAEETALALKKEQELNELKSRFVSIASHEFRTPLSTIASSLSLIESYEAPTHLAKRNKHINRIYANIQLLTTILNDFLSLSKLEEGKIINQPQLFNLNEFMSNLIDEVKETDKEQHTFIYTYKGSNEIYLDKKLLNNIVLNLLSNAVKYSEVNTQIFISVDVANEIKIEIKDEGIGIPASEQNQLFERFFRANNVSNIQGTGLGLNIVQKYTELMNGSILFSSEEGKGTTFTVEFPNTPKK